MKLSAYTIIPFLVLAGPLALSFDERVNFIQYWPAVLAAVVLIGGLYILWDVLVVQAGHWSFNDQHVGVRRWFHLPPGEWLFFLTVPYACLFIYEVVRSYFGPGQSDPAWTWLQAALVMPFALGAWIWRRQGYTMLALGSVAAFWALSVWLAPGLVANSDFWGFTGLSLVAFVVVNGTYTALPTISYNPKAIWGPKAGTIPLEDFFYNFSFLGLSLLVFLTVKTLLGLP